MCFILAYWAGLISQHTPRISHLFISSFIIYCSVCWIMLHFKYIDHNKHSIKALYMPVQFSKYVILNAIRFSQNWYSKTLGNSKSLNMLFVAFQTVRAPYAITSLYTSKVQRIECSANEVFRLHFVHRISNITL
jgi:hypothetical protein